MLINVQYVLWECVDVIVFESHLSSQVHVNDHLVRDVVFHLCRSELFNLLDIASL